MKKKITIHMLALVLLAGTVVEAQTNYTWDTGTGDWNTAGNWSPLGPPTATDNAFITNGGTATISSNAAVDELQLGVSSGEVGNIIQNGGTFETFGEVWIGAGGSGTYTMNDGQLINNFRLRLGRNAGDEASSFYHNNGTVQGQVLLFSAGSLYEISGGTFTNDSGWGRLDNTTVRIVGGAASIGIQGLGFRNDGEGATMEFVLDNSSTHISTITHTNSGNLRVRRDGHLAAKLQGGVLLSDESQFNLVQSYNSMTDGWASTPGDLWTYSGNVLDGGQFYEQIALDAGADKGSLDASIIGSTQSFADAAFGYVDLTGGGASLELKLDWSALSAANISDFTGMLTDAGISNWLISANEIGILLDPSISGGSYFAWDTQGIGSGGTDGLISGITVIPEPATFFMLGLAGLALICTRRKKG